MNFNCASVFSEHLQGEYLPQGDVKSKEDGGWSVCMESGLLEKSIDACTKFATGLDKSCWEYLWWDKRGI